MRFLSVFNKKTSICAVALCLVMLSTSTLGQDRGQQGPIQSTDVIRITTELVQTDLVVVDKQGRFVDSLKPEQFELSLDGKAQPISFFERVKTGSIREAAQLASTRGVSANKARANVGEVGSPNRGRLIFFFLDDVHLSGASIAQARKTLANYVDNHMDPNDLVAIASTSGQIGFLQQLTDNPAVLHTAISRLGHKQNPAVDTGRTPITEYMASQILDAGNRELYAYLLESVKVEMQVGPGIRHGDHRLAATYSAAPYLKNRLRQINAQGQMATSDTLSAFESLMLSSASLPGRKIVFFLSDGFVLNERRAGALEALRRVTQAAERARAVIYSMDLHASLFNWSSGIDASSNDYIDLTARRTGLGLGGLTATQEPLRIMADETGGRAFLTASSIDEGILKAIDETSDYFLLAWRPESEAQRTGKSKIKVIVKDRPDLTVRLRTSFYFQPLPAADTSKSKPDSSSSNSKSEKQPAETELLTALGTLYPNRELPTSVAAGYVSLSPSGTALRISMQIERGAFSFDPEGGPQKAELDVIGAAVDDRGLISTFKQVLTVTNAADQDRTQPVVWNQQLSLPPGLYQVRVAVRERGTGRTGSAMQWIEVPDLSKGLFNLSSLFLGERKDHAAEESKAPGGPQPIIVDVDHRFSRRSVLRFQTYVYNAGGGTRTPDVWIQAQVIREKRPIVAMPLARVPTDAVTDHARLPYWAEIGLGELPPGRYSLLVTATDRNSNRSASQRVNFVVE